MKSTKIKERWCIIDGHQFEVWTGNPKQNKKRTIRQRNSKTCSRKCAKIFSRVGKLKSFVPHEKYLEKHKDEVRAKKVN